MQVSTFKTFFIILCCATAFAKGQPDSNEYVRKIREKIAEATNIVVADQESKNSKQDIIGSALSGLVLFLKTLLVPTLTIALNIPSYLLNAIGGALDGLGKSGLIGLLGGLARSAAIGIRQVNGQVGENFLEVSDPKQNEIIKENIRDAVMLGVAELDAPRTGCSDVDANLNYVFELVGLFLSYIYSFIPYLTTVLGSAINGLIKGLKEGLAQNDLIGGILGSLNGLLDGLATGSIKAFGGFLSNLLA